MEPGAILRKARRGQGMYMRQVGDALGVTESAVCRYEKGLREIPLELMVPWALLVGSRDIITNTCLSCPVGRVLGAEAKGRPPEPERPIA